MNNKINNLKNVATISANGLMSASDKTKLNNIGISGLNVFRFTNIEISNGAVQLNYPSGFDRYSYYFVTCQYIPGSYIYWYIVQRESRLIIYVRTAINGSISTFLGTIPTIDVLAIK